LTLRCRSSKTAAGLDQLIDETVAQPDHRFDLRADSAELGTQTADMNVDRAGLDEPVISPDPFQQPIA
jgi:hypothetical protein